MLASVFLVSFLLVSVCGDWNLQVINNVNPCSGGTYTNTITLFLSANAQTNVAKGSSQNLLGSQIPSLGLGIQENGEYCRSHGAESGCLNPDNAGMELVITSGNCESFTLNDPFYCGTYPPNAKTIVNVAMSGTWPNCVATLTRLSSAPGCSSTCTGTPAPTPAPTTAAPTPPPAPAPTPKPTSAPAPTPAPVSATCAASNSHVRCWGLGGGAVQSSQAACAAAGCSGGSTTWSWNAIGGACWTGTAQYCLADSGTVSDGSAQWYSGGAQTNINSCATSLPHIRCWGLGGGAVQSTAAACAQVGCSSGSTAWSWNAQGGACWTGTAQYCLGDTGTNSDGTPQWISGGSGANVQSEQAVVGSSTWFKQKGYWIVVAIVILLILIGVILYFTFRSRNRGNSFEAPEKAAVTPTAATQPDSVAMTPTAVTGEEQMLKPTDGATPAPADAPWVPRKDESGNTYYYNEKTGASQWETPDV